MTQARVLTVVVCLFKNVTALDFQGPVELFSLLNPENARKYTPQSLWHLRLTFLADTLDPVDSTSGLSLVPQGTYADAIDKNTQYDILLIPGGPEARPDAVPKDLMRFLNHQIPKARYVLSVCTGSWILAGTGILDGKRATTNKFSFNSCKAATSKKIDWVPKARWVVDGNVWTSSGVTAGADMANAFLVHLVGEDIAKVIRNIVELSPRNADEDEFAAVHGLLGDS